MLHTTYTYIRTMVLGVGIITPTLALGATIEDVILTVGRLVSMVTPVAFALALLFFFYGLAMFILKSGNTGEQEKGKQLMIYGTLALFVMASIFGLVTLLQSTFQISGSDSLDIPMFCGGSTC